MNRYLFLSILSYCCLGLVSCNETESQPEASVKEAEAPEVTYTYPEISPGEACNRIAAFAGQAEDAVIPDYYSLAADDAIAILDTESLSEDGTVMYGYNESHESDSAIEKFDLIFVMYDSVNEVFRYYDFTQPCPTFCPGKKIKRPGEKKKSDLAGTVGYTFVKSTVGAYLTGNGASQVFSIISLDEGNISGPAELITCEENQPTTCTSGVSLPICTSGSGSGACVSGCPN